MFQAIFNLDLTLAKFCSFFLTKALKELEEKHHQNAEHRKEIEEAISWYNRVLGFRIECGYGMSRKHDQSLLFLFL